MSYTRIEPVSVNGMELITPFVWRDTGGIKHNDKMYYYDNALYISRDDNDAVEMRTISNYKNVYLNLEKVNELNRTILDFINGRGL